MPLNRITKTPTNSEKLESTLAALRDLGIGNVHAETVQDEHFGLVITNLVHQKDASDENRAVIGKHIADLLVAIKHERTGAHAKIFEAPNFGVALHYLSAVFPNAPKECVFIDPTAKPIVLNDSQTAQTSAFMGAWHYAGLPTQVYEHIAPAGRKLDTFISIPVNHEANVQKHTGLTASYNLLVASLDARKPSKVADVNCFYLATSPLEAKHLDLPEGHFFRIKDSPRGRVVEGWNNPTQTAEQRKSGLATYSKMASRYKVEQEFSVSSMLSMPDNLIAREHDGSHIVFVAGRVLEHAGESSGWVRATFDHHGNQTAAWHEWENPYLYVPNNGAKKHAHISFTDDTTQAPDLSPEAHFDSKVDTPVKASIVIECAGLAITKALADTKRLKVEIDDALRAYSQIAYSSSNRLHSVEKTMAYDRLRNACAEFETAVLSVKRSVRTTDLAYKYLGGRADISISQNVKALYPDLSLAMKQYNRLLEDVFYLNPIMVDGKKVKKDESFAVPVARQVVLRPPVLDKRAQAIRLLPPLTIHISPRLEPLPAIISSNDAVPFQQ